jgi:cobalt-zinc-cadmium efflux system protein
MSGHHHDHTGSDHSHGVSADANQRYLAIALGLILGFMAVEVAAGLIAHSLALLSDAAHMLTDAAAIGLSLWAARLALRPARGAMTYGFRRAEILSAQANGITLLLLAILIVIEAIRRLLAPPDVDAGLILAIAMVGIVVNVAATWVLARANRQSLNVEGSFQHILTDLYAFIGTAVAACVILATGFNRADPIASLFVAALMLRAAYFLLKASGRIFLEAAPEGIDVEAVGQALAEQPGVVEVHDLHIWEVTSGFPALSAHVLVEEKADCHEARRDLDRLLHDRFQLTHTTLQVEHCRPSLVELQSGRLRRRGDSRTG